jgi:hypothetical protein
MNGKIKVIVMVLFVLLTVETYAQKSLSEGYYQTQGSEQFIFIAKDKTSSGKGNTPEQAFKKQQGSYGVMLWLGFPKPDNSIWIGTGNIVGSEFHITVERRSPSRMAEHGMYIASGTMIIFNVIDTKTFLDEWGQRWVWRRKSFDDL